MHDENDGSREYVWSDHAFVDLVLTACERSDDQAEICALVDGFVAEGTADRSRRSSGFNM